MYEVDAYLFLLFFNVIGCKPIGCKPAAWHWHLTVLLTAQSKTGNQWWSQLTLI